MFVVKGAIARLVKKKSFREMAKSETFNAFPHISCFMSLVIERQRASNSAS
jgi:hypothetical protein